MNEIEIEFKALLNKNTYEELLKSISDAVTFKQVNHYFDTEDEILRRNKMALRVRVKDTCIKMTVKSLIDEEKALYNEISDFLGNCEVKRVLNNKVIESDIIIEYLKEQGIHATQFPKSNVFTTHRTVCQFDDHTLFLDETIYENGITDYELEIESENYEDCKKSFHNYAQKYDLEHSMTHKIERAIRNSK